MSVMSTSRNCTAGFIHLASRHNCQHTNTHSDRLKGKKSANIICNLAYKISAGKLLKYIINEVTDTKGKLFIYVICTVRQSNG